MRTKFPKCSEYFLTSYYNKEKKLIIEDYAEVIEQALTQAENKGRLTNKEINVRFKWGKGVADHVIKIETENEKQKKRIAQLEKEVALLQDVEVHLQVCENNKKALVDICEQYKQENKRLKAELSK